MAAVTNYHKCGALKQHTWIILQFWRTTLERALQGRNQGVSGAAFFVEALGEDGFLALPEATPFLGTLHVPYCALVIGAFVLAISLAQRTLAQTTT